MKKSLFLLAIGCISLIISFLPPILENTLLALFFVLMGAILIMVTLFAKPLIIRKNHMSYRKQYAQNSLFSVIDSNNRDNKTSYAQKVIFINQFYKSHACSLNDFSFITELGERELFLTENLRDEQALNEFQKSLIFAIFLPFIIKLPITTNANDVIIVIIGIATYLIYYLVVVMSDGINVENKLNSYEISKITTIMNDLDVSKPVTTSKNEF